MKASEAKSRWCPFARVARREKVSRSEDGMIGGTNRDAFGNVLNPNSCRCLATDCMAWRGSEEVGFCGLAGRPVADVVTVAEIEEIIHNAGDALGSGTKDAAVAIADRMLAVMHRRAAS